MAWVWTPAIKMCGILTQYAGFQVMAAVAGMVVPEVSARFA
jgi:hypothetical protein